MEKKCINNWIIGFLIIIILMQFTEKYFEGFTSMGQTSPNGYNIQQNIGKRADSLYIFIFCILIIFLCFILYLSLLSLEGSTTRDIEDMITNNAVINFLGTIFTYFTQGLSNLFNNLGIPLFVLLIIFLIIIKSTNYQMYDAIIIVFFFILFFIPFSSIKDFDKMIESMGYGLFGFILVVSILFIILGTVPIPGIPEEHRSYPLTIGLLLIIFDFMLFKRVFNLILTWMRKGSFSIFLAVFIIILGFGISYITNGHAVKGSFLIILLLVYFIGFIAHVIIYHGKSAVEAFSFLKIIPTTFENKKNLENNPNYFLLEGFLYEPFYKVVTFLNRRSYDKLHDYFT